MAVNCCVAPGAIVGLAGIGHLGGDVARCRVAVGVPEMAPVPLLSVRPGGSVPLAIVQVYGGRSAVGRQRGRVGVRSALPSAQRRAS